MIFIGKFIYIIYSTVYASFICAVFYHFCHDIIPVYNLYVHNCRIFTYTVNVSFLDNVLHNKVYFTLKNVLSYAHWQETEEVNSRCSRLSDVLYPFHTSKFNPVE